MISHFSAIQKTGKWVCWIFLAHKCHGSDAALHPACLCVLFSQLGPNAKTGKSWMSR